MKIAIVDDEVKWRNLASDVVKGYTEKTDKIDTFESGVEFIKNNGEYNVVLMDVDMPEMDGFETIMNYKEQYSESIIIILTTHLNCARKGYLVDAFRYVDKTKMKYGLVCYHIDTGTKFPSNMNYSGSKWNYQVVGGEQSTKTDAALAVGEDIEIYGKIKIEVTDINDNVLTFKINGDFAEHVNSGGEATCVKRAVCSE